MKEHVLKGEVPHCKKCDGLVKPDIVFLGGALPERFQSNTHVPAQADLLIILGTSLSVHPFASLPDYALEGTPRVLINMERVGSLGSLRDDVLLLGDCNNGVRKLADELGWRDELEELYKQVGGEKAQQPQPETSKTKHENLEDEIEKLTGEVDHALKISDGHRKYLEKHLADKTTKAEGHETSEVEKPIDHKVHQTESATLERVDTELDTSTPEGGSQPPMKKGDESDPDVSRLQVEQFSKDLKEISNLRSVSTNTDATEGENPSSSQLANSESAATQAGVNVAASEGNDKVDLKSSLEDAAGEKPKI